MTERKETLFPAIPGAISRQTLEAIENFEMLGWFSLKEKDLQGLFIPEPKMGDLEHLQDMNNQAIAEIQRAIKTYEQNRGKTNTGKVPKQELSPYVERVKIKDKEKEEIHIRVGTTTPEVFALIPDRFSRIIISSLMKPGARMTADEIYGHFRKTRKSRKVNIEKAMKTVVQDNVDVLNALFGFAKVVKKDRGFYYFAPLPT